MIVVGLGAFGSAITRHLAEGGAKVIGIDRFHPPHPYGSSHGETRITRLAIGEGDVYVPIVRRSHELWRELEATTGASLMKTTGGLVIASKASGDLPYHGQLGFFEQTLGAAKRFGIAHELLDAAEIRRRFPAFLAAGDERGYWERDAGILFPERCVEAQLAMAASAGADLHYGTMMREWRETVGAAAIEVRTDRGDISAAHVVLATGAWLPASLPAAQRGRFAVQRQVLHWFATDDPDLYAPDRCPVFIWMHGANGEAFYGFPRADAVDGIKVATEQSTSTTSPDEVARTVSHEETAHMYETHIRGRLRNVLSRSVSDATCLYTSIVDGRFVIGRHRDSSAVTLVSACSGHGFKHSAAIGEAIAESLLGRTPRVSLSEFELST